MNLTQNTFVAFYHQGELKYGSISGTAGNQYLVCSLAGEQFSLPSARFVLCSSAALQISPKDFVAKLEAARDGFNSSDFAFLASNPLSLHEIALQLNLTDDAQLFGLYLFLKQNSAWFDHKKDKFRLKTQQEQAAHLKQSEETRLYKHYLLEVEGYIQGGEISDTAQHRLFKELPGLLGDRKHKELLTLIQKAYPHLEAEAAVQEFRFKCGELPANTDPIIAAADIPVGFSRLLLSEPLIPVSARDAAITTAFCIDDADTRDYDDAISLQKTNEGFVLGIHVSRVANRLVENGSLYQEAQNRVSSLYTANQVIPMLPPQLSETELSLIKNQVRPTLSLYAYLDGSLRIISKKLVCDMVTISENYRYSQVDRQLGSEPFAGLKSICQTLEVARESSAERGEKQGYYYVKERDGSLQLKYVNPESPSRRIVEELMILYNSTLAAYAREHNLPMIYRNVNKFSIPGEDFPATQAYLSTRAEFHPGIGAAAYLHASSPIRRFTDLINQQQITASLEKSKLPYTAETLEQTIIQVEKKLNRIKELNHLSERYWWLRYIEQKCLETPFEVLFRGQNHGLLRVEILKWGIQVLVQCEATPDTEIFTLIFTHVNWDKGYIEAQIL